MFQAAGVTCHSTFSERRRYKKRQLGMVMMVPQAEGTKKGLLPTAAIVNIKAIVSQLNWIKGILSFFQLLTK